ncbi:hypothetical protein DM02DRAFT_650647 [Periconia macrospinosa]|uniref:Uncharacterized protein n=1 Tax=Periconia macrospinosa TaxID=97972 RepID=A0A2V1E4Y5_9PLEO|nr:hypothetical protein DM02DRAFT_650647 [Periconia macrospinosa]
MPPKRSPPKKSLKRKRTPSSSSPPRNTRKKQNPPPTDKTTDTTPSSSSLTTLHPPVHLSHSLAQKVHNLILISRQIEAIWRGWFHGSRSDVKQRMAELEILYDALRDDVSAELRAACLSSGQTPSKVLKGLPVFPPTHRVHGSLSVKPKIPKRGVFDLEYSIDKELRHEKERAEREDEINSSSDEDEEEEIKFEVLQPIGVMRAEIPLTKGEKEMMGKFSWKRKKAKGGQKDVCVSPRGTETVYF